MAEGMDLPSAADDDLVVIFRADSLAEAKKAAEILTHHGLAHQMDREMGVGYTQYTEHFAVEETHSFVVLVEERHADYAERLLDGLGLASMMPPEQMETRGKPWAQAWRRRVLLFLVLLFVASAVFVLLAAFGIFDF